MTLWDKFFESGRIEDYLTYAAHRKEDTDNADLYGTCLLYTSDAADEL